MSKLFNSIPNNLLYSSYAAKGLNLCGKYNRLLTKFALVDSRCVTSTLLSLMLRYSPNEVRVHLFTMNSSSELLRCVRDVHDHHKDRSTVETLNAFKYEGDHYFCQISSITKVCSLTGLIQGLHNYYVETVVPTVSTMTTLKERSVTRTFEMPGVSTTREVVFIELDDVPFETEDTNPLKRIINVMYHLREYAGLNIIFVTSTEKHLFNLDVWPFIEQVISPYDNAGYVELVVDSEHLKYHLPFAEREDIIACYEANTVLCSKYHKRE